MTKNFKHKELGWLAINTWLSAKEIFEWYKVYDKNWLLVFWDHWITSEKLLLLWFEEEDWIDSAYEYYQTPIPAKNKSNDIWYPMKFREAIEKHMPRITKQEIENLKDDPEDMLTVYVSWKRVIKLLKSKGLLSE